MLSLLLFLLLSSYCIARENCSSISIAPCVCVSVMWQFKSEAQLLLFFLSQKSRKAPHLITNQTNHWHNCKNANGKQYKWIDWNFIWRQQIIWFRKANHSPLFSIVFASIYSIIYSIISNISFTMSVSIRFMFLTCNAFL